MTITRWKKKIAVVTGASAGIGTAICIELCRNQIMTIGLARRVEKTEELREVLTPNQQRFFLSMKCDVSNEKEVVEVFAEIVKKFGGIDILVNNAGVASTKALTEVNNSAEMKRVMDTNVMGLINCTREAVKSLRERNTEGHIIHVNSTGGHQMAYNKDYKTFGIYHASKYAVTAITEQHRQEFIRDNLNIKVTSLSPGAVLTEMMNTLGFDKLPKEVVDQILKTTPFLESKDVADAVIYLLSTPSKVLVTELTIRPMNETH